MATPSFKRILLKLSGEALMGSQNYGIDTKVAEAAAREIKTVHDLGIEIAIVVGGGNIFRGVSESAGNMDRAAADYIGMLATVMNAVVLQDALEQIGVYTRVMSAIDIPQLAEPFIRRRAVRHLEKQRVVIFAAGTGNPYFTTDSAAALRALEIEAEVTYVGRSSIETRIIVYAEPLEKAERRKVGEGFGLYVALDEEGKPRAVPKLPPSEISDAAEARQAARLALREAARKS